MEPKKLDMEAAVHTMALVGGSEDDLQDFDGLTQKLRVGRLVLKAYVEGMKMASNDPSWARVEIAFGKGLIAAYDDGLAEITAQEVAHGSE